MKKKIEQQFYVRILVHCCKTMAGDYPIRKHSLQEPFLFFWEYIAHGTDC